MFQLYKWNKGLPYISVSLQWDSHHKDRTMWWYLIRLSEILAPFSSHYVLCPQQSKRLQHINRSDKYCFLYYSSNQSTVISSLFPSHDTELGFGQTSNLSHHGANLSSRRHTRSRNTFFALREASTGITTKPHPWSSTRPRSLSPPSAERCTHR